jgi:hypothetical protein
MQNIKKKVAYPRYLLEHQISGLALGSASADVTLEIREDAMSILLC